MNRAYRKNIRRTIGKSKGRFFAIMAIIALGVGFFAGLKVTKPGMIQTADTYLRDHKFYDFRVLSTYGFDEDEVSSMREEKQVLAAEGAVSEDFLYMGEDGTEVVFKACSITEKVNTLELRAGRMPKAADECVLDAYQYDESMIGQQITVSDNNSKDTKEMFSYDSYTVVGLVNSPSYINMERGTTSLGNGRISAFIYLEPEGFCFDYYTELYVLCQDQYGIYTDGYEDFIEETDTEIKQAAQTAADERFAELEAEVQEKYDDAVAKINESVTEEVTAQVREQVKAQMYAELMQQGMTEAMIDGMFASGQLSLPEDTIEETAKPIIEEKTEELVAEIEKPELEEPEIYVFDRSSNTGYMCYDNDTNIVDGVAKVFPIFFFLIAALVCSTTMTRMVDDERGQIGTLRALGYSNGAIISKYLIYSGTSAIIGCIVGFFAGSWLFPYVIWNAYRMLYDFGDGLEFYFSLPLLLICIAVSLICSMGTTFFACKNELRCMPADLIRPKAPAAGKRIWMEKIGFLWKRMKFLHKVTARNVFRFKKRMLMMIVGIAGCTALVLTGLGVRDSVVNLAEFQYGDIDVHDLEVIFNDPITEEDLKAVKEAAGKGMIGSVSLYKTSVEYHTDSAVKTVYVVAAEPGSLDEYVNFTLKEGTGEYPEYGEVFLSERIAQIAEVQVGDSITFTDGDEGEITLKVGGIYENYVWHYAYMTPETYEDYFEKEYQPNTMYVNTEDDETAFSVGAKLRKLDSVMNVMVVPEMKERVENMMTMMNAVVWLVIG
ncbi:MAG: ABC transporter permease, partial [Lachnospiraceae bacterium]